MRMLRFSTRPTTLPAALWVSMKFCDARDYWKESGALIRMRISALGKKRRLTACMQLTHTSMTMSLSAKVWTSGSVRSQGSTC